VAGPFIGKYIKYVRDIHAYAKKTVRLREHLFRAHIPDSNKATPNMIPGAWGRAVDHPVKIDASPCQIWQVSNQRYDSS